MKVEIGLQFKNTLFKIIESVGEPPFVLFTDNRHKFDFDQSYVNMVPVGNNVVIVSGDYKITRELADIYNIPINIIPNIPLYKHIKYFDFSFIDKPELIHILSRGIITSINNESVKLIYNNISYWLTIQSGLSIDFTKDESVKIGVPLFKTDIPLNKLCSIVNIDIYQCINDMNTVVTDLFKMENK